MKLPNLDELFLHELKDIYDAEYQLTEALPKMAKAATDSELATAFANHLQETRGHVARLEKVFRECDEEPERETCRGMRGLIAEGEKLMHEDAEPAVRDAALISAAQRVEHYEMAAYGTLRNWAGILGHTQAQALLEETLGEEQAADETLTEIADRCVNVQAAEGEVEDQEREPNGSPQPKSRSPRRTNQPARSRRSSSKR